MPEMIADKYTAILREQVEKDFLNYQTDERYQAVHSLMKRQIFSSGEIVATYRVLHHWEEKKLLPDGVSQSGGKWRKFTRVEAAWLKVVSRLREFGVPLDKIATVKEYVMEWDNKTYSYPLVEFHLVSAIFTAYYDPYVVVFLDGSAVLANSIQIEAMKMVGAGDDMLLISLKSIAKEMGLPVTKTAELKPLFEGESELLSRVRDKENGEVIARKKKRKITEIETTTVFPDVTKLSQVRRDLKNSREYAEVSIKLEEGREQSFQVKKKKKIK